MSAAEKALIESLASAGAPIPTLGHETKEGLPIDISWPEHLVAVDLDLNDEDRDELRQEGWTLVDADPETILSTLANIGAS